MDDNATHSSIGLSQERKLYLGQILLKRPTQRYVVSTKTQKPPSHAKRAMQTRGANLYSLRLETTYT
jgi:hypothetical protein